MQHVLGNTVFSIPDAFRDETIYLYTSPDEKWVLRVSPTREAIDVDSALATAKAGFDEFFGESIIYVNPLRIAGANGSLIKGYEGEVGDAAVPLRRRFGLFAMGDGGAKAVFLLTGEPARFLIELARLEGSVRFLDGFFDPALGATPGRIRAQADSVSFEVPADWSLPTTLVFRASAEDARLRITLDELPSAEGAISLEEELPATDGDRVRILSRVIVRDHPRNGSWTGAFTVEHVTEGGTQIVEMCKACVTYSARTTVTAYGKVAKKNAPTLNVAWDTFLGSLRGRAP